MLADLDERAAHGHTRHNKPCNAAGGDTGRGFAGRRASAAAIIANAVFDVIGIVGMAGTIAAGDLAIILGTLIGILDKHRDRRAGRDHRLAVLVEHHARENLDDVIFAPLGDETRLAGLALVHPGLNVGMGEAQSGRAAIDHATECGTMAFAPGRNAEKMAERIVGHEDCLAARALEPPVLSRLY
ncbi:hypothetical protein D3C80_827730 [compost metagenome]